MNRGQKKKKRGDEKKERETEEGRRSRSRRRRGSRRRRRSRREPGEARVSWEVKLTPLGFFGEASFSFACFWATSRKAACSIPNQKKKRKKKKKKNKVNVDSPLGRKGC